MFELEKEIYRNQSIDMRKLLVRFAQKIWIPVLAAALGMLFAAGLYEICYLSVNGPMYQAQSKVYIDFAPGDGADVYHQYYNGYTWNDLMSTDPILDKTMDALAKNGVSVERSLVAASTEAKILSDVRLLTIYITNEDKTLCEQMQKATEQALQGFGEERDVFTGIYTIKSDETKRIMSDYRMKQAVLLGLVIAAISSVLILLGYLILDDRIFAATDLLGVLDVPFVGMELKAENGIGPFVSDFQANMERMCPGGEGLCEIMVDEVLKERAETIDYEKLRGASFVLVKASFGKTTIRSLQYVLHQLRLQGCEKVGVALTDTDEKWLRCYYRWGKAK